MNGRAHAVVWPWDGKRCRIHELPVNVHVWNVFDTSIGFE